MLTTQDASGQLRSRPMGVSGELESSGNTVVLNFFTVSRNRKTSVELQPASHAQHASRESAVVVAMVAAV